MFHTPNSPGDLERQRELLDLQQGKARSEVIMAVGEWTVNNYSDDGPPNLTPDGSGVQKAGVFKKLILDGDIAEEIGFYAQGTTSGEIPIPYDNRVSVAQITFEGAVKPLPGFSNDAACQTVAGLQAVESFRHLMPQLSADLTTIETL